MMMRLFVLVAGFSSAFAQGVITTVAGNDAIFTDDGKPAISAPIVGPTGLAVDAAGNVFFASPALNMVLKVDTKGIVSVVAGNGLKGYSGDGGPARAATLATPTAVAVDRAGNVFIVDSENNRIARVGADGIIRTVAGNGGNGPSGDGGPATEAHLSLPAFGGGRTNGIAVDASGNLYIADRYNNRIRKVNAAGIISTIAGNGQPVHSGDGGPAVNAGIIQPAGIRLDAVGNLLVTEPFGQIRRILTNGNINTIQGTQNAAGVATDAAGSVYFADPVGQRIRKVVSGSVIPVAGNGQSNFSGDGGPAANAALSSPTDVVVDSNGNIYIADRDNDRIRKIDANGTITTLAGAGASVGDGGPATSARLDQPSHAAMDSAGNLYIADAGNSRIRKVAPDGLISTVAGNGRAGFGGDGGPATSALLNTPIDVAVDSAGNLYIAESDNGRVRKVSTSGIITTYAGGGQSRVDGAPATSSNLSYPLSVAVDGAGNVYVAEVDFGTVRKITPGGTISTIAGNGTRGYSGDGGPGPAASLSGSFFAMMTDTAGNLYISDSDNHRVRKVDINGIITSFAGNGSGDYAGDGGPASKAAVPNPSGLAQDRAGNFYIASVDGNVRVVKPDGTIRQYAGVAPGQFGFSGDGGPASAAVFSGPIGAALDATGNLYIADRFNRRVRLIQGGPSPSIVASQKGLTFIASSGSGAPAPQSFTIVNGGQGTLNWGVAASTTSGGSWLSVTPSGGSSSAGNAGPPVQVSVNPSGLAAGDYYGQIVVRAPAAPNSPQSITVVLNVRAPGTGVGSIVQPSGLLFTAATPQTLTLSTLSTSAVTFSGTASFGGPSWFTMSPASGTTVSGKPAVVQIVPNVAGLTNGVYNGNITFAFGDNSVQIVQLILVVSAGGGPQPNAPGGRPAGCTPARLLPLFTSLGAGFTITTGWPSPVEVRVVDDCGQPLTKGTVTANFSNTDPTLTLNSLGDGRWAGTWTAQNAAATVSVTASAANADKSVSGTAQVNGGLSRNANPPPVVAAGGVLNAASYQLQGSLAPGSLVAIFGSILSQGAVSAPSLPLSNTLGSTTVTIAGRKLPLLYAGPDQVNAMIPYDLPINASHQVVVQRGTALSNPEAVGVLSSQSGVFTKDLTGKGAGIVVRVTADGTQSVVGSDNPTQAYEALVIYCAGLGDVDPRQIAGQEAGFAPLSQTIDPVKVTIGGIDAPVFFAGLTPGFTGLYQVNAYVPVGVAPGNNVRLVITQAGRASPPVSISVR